MLGALHRITARSPRLWAALPLALVAGLGLTAPASAVAAGAPAGHAARVTDAGLITFPLSRVKGYALEIVAERDRKDGRVTLIVGFARAVRVRNAAATKGREAHSYVFTNLAPGTLSIGPGGTTATLDTGHQLGSFGTIRMSLSGVRSSRLPGCPGHTGKVGTLRGSFTFHAGSYFGTLRYVSLPAGILSSGRLPCAQPPKTPAQPSPTSKTCPANLFSLMAGGGSPSSGTKAAFAFRNGSNLAVEMFVIKSQTLPKVDVIDTLGFELPFSALTFAGGSGTVATELAAPFFTGTLSFGGREIFAGRGCTFYTGTGGGMSGHFDSLGTVTLTGVPVLTLTG